MTSAARRGAVKLSTVALAALTYTVVAATAISPALAKKNQPANDQATGSAAVSVVFTSSERQIISQYFARPDARGAAKPLPPGIAKKVARGGRLPPGIAKRYLPGDLAYQLPPASVGTERIIVGVDVLLVEVGTDTVLDIIRGALGR